MTPQELKSHIHRLLLKSAEQQDRIDQLENELWLARNAHREEARIKAIRDRGYLLEPVDNSAWG